MMQTIASLALLGVASAQGMCPGSPMQMCRMMYAPRRPPSHPFHS
jgi:hypothetical protein|eukprot:COSAG01_NODE_5606_length_4150_cov_3.488028_1_plen_45_part_00